METNVKADLEQLKGQELLVELNKRWKNHEVMVKWMKLLFQYLDRFYCEMHSCTKLNDQGFKIFKEVVFHPLCEPTTKAIIDEISKQRNGEQMVEVELLKGTINIYLHLCTGKLAQDGFLPRNNLDKAILS